MSQQQKMFDMLIEKQQLIEAVRHMRDMQKLYFKTRDKDALKRSIIAEKIVDKLLEGKEQ